MTPECLPFSQIPGTTGLFHDFLFDHSKVEIFYPRTARLADWQNREVITYSDERRRQLAAILERQNRAWDASPQTLQNISRLAAGASALVTGQQVGLFGGPPFALFKALTAIHLAAEATREGRECVPVFWLATEDHDLAEVNQAYFPDNGALRSLTAPTEGTPGAPVGCLVFGEGIARAVEEAASLLGDSEISDLLRRYYRAGEAFGAAFARLFSRLFAKWGVILLDAADPELHRVAAPIYRQALQRSAQLDEALLARGKELEAAGYHQQVRVTPSSTLLFSLQNGVRMPIHRRPNSRGAEEFIVGEETFRAEELLARIESAPQAFSPNVLLRPVVQDYLLPTLAYTGGAAEIAYFAQAAVVYRELLGRVTPILPRFSATLVEPKSKALLDRYGLSLLDVFHGPEKLREELAARALPQALQTAFDQADESLDQSLAMIRERLERLDKTLADAAVNAGTKMHHQLDSLRSKAARAESRHTEILGRHADLLSTMLYPNKGLQERTIAGVYFLAEHGVELLQGVYDAMRADCVDHQVIPLQASYAESMVSNSSSDSTRVRPDSR